VRRGSLLARCVVLGLCVILGACATVAEKPVAAPEVSRAPAAPAPAPPPPPPPDPRVPLVERHRERAEALEKDGQLRRAMDEWKIALTIDPSDEKSKKGMTALEGRIEKAVTERIEAGKAALGRGVQPEARRQFLAALALDPTNKVAFQALQNEARDVESINYTVKQGDTLASLAQRFYGDRSRLEVIWETNQLPPNPKLTPGMTLKIPEIPGVPFVHPEAPRKAPTTTAALPPAPSAPKPEAAPAEEEPQQPQVNPMLAEAREALDRKDWNEALSDVDRFLATSPGNADGIAVKKQALYQQGKTQLDSRRYTESYRALVQLARLQPDYEDSAKLLQQARARAVEQHYAQGLRLYQEEKLAEAISEWRLVLDLDPQHANAKKNLDQAEKLQKALDQRKKK